MIRIGSRGSQLALWQANFIAGQLRGLGHEAAIEIIRTTGDRMQEVALPAADGKGIFTREIEEALLAGRIDLAVHSLKDLPTELSADFTLAAIPRRADARDVLVSVTYASLEELPCGAVIGTGSLRRQAQLLALRPDLRCIEFRGNVDTRLAKLAQGKADALILAAAGLDRLEKTAWIRQRFAPTELCPAAGQGALGIECRAGDRATQAALQPLEDRDARRAITAERRLLEALGGGCQTPIGAFCRKVNAPAATQGEDSEQLCLTGVVASPDGSAILRRQMRDSEPARLADALAAQLLADGAAALLSAGASRP
ncbi:MAG TPA: hydroxymethylbilane synthase [Acidobacteriaceae bacterium]|nr:hydroxymethylbilane synthase [Acidobacteriaceae bacterium]